MDASFAVRNHRSDGCEVIELAGELDMATAPHLEAILDRMLIIPDEIVVEVGMLTFIDSSGLRLLLRASQLVEGRIRLRGCSPQIVRLVDIAGLSGAFTLEDPPEVVGIQTPQIDRSSQRRLSLEQGSQDGRAESTSG